eukprot:gnl/Hemi2/21726_TR7247_c0_g1_i1.p2 gnl/Hemi2/21726_TR7247_c0_g1~~gnl/Hemi2/21726_TR7247_c0_g1_i1.p2  ORF type:complete len:187 (+),score=38.96 gnl/Hemi2/21726_TR7247_c0_g1_i1:40-561(+)
MEGVSVIRTQARPSQGDEVAAHPVSDATHVPAPKPLARPSRYGLTTFKDTNYITQPGSNTSHFASPADRLCTVAQAMNRQLDPLSSRQELANQQSRNQVRYARRQNNEQRVMDTYRREADQVAARDAGRISSFAHQQERYTTVMHHTFKPSQRKRGLFHPANAKPSGTQKSIV